MIGQDNVSFDDHKQLLVCASTMAGLVYQEISKVPSLIHIRPVFV